jgi:hypothetical protein
VLEVLFISRKAQLDDRRRDAMTLRRITITALLATFFIAALATSTTVLAQSTDQPTQVKKEDETNLDTQLYLIVGTNQEVTDARVPKALEPVISQMRASLPFKNYKISATLINRVKNKGRLNLKWIGGPLLGSAADTARTPSFNEFRVNQVELSTDAEGRQVVRMEGFGFGARIPIQSGTTVASSGPAAPIINYEQTGLNTDISFREGEPVIVGTLNVGPSGDAIILVMSVKRSTR